MAVRIDADQDYFTRSSDLLDYNANYTWMGWVYFIDLTSSNVGMIFDLTLSGTEHDALRIVDDPDGRLEIAVDNVVVTGTALSAATWYHLTMVRRGVTDREIYLDGVSDITSSQDTTGRSAGSGMFVGDIGVVSVWSNARFAGMKAWATDLSVAEIANEMSSIVPRTFPNLYGWWPVFPGSGERTRDYSGNGRDWTENGTLTDEAGPPVTWGVQPAWSMPVAAPAAGAPHELFLQGTPTAYPAGPGGWN